VARALGDVDFAKFVNFRPDVVKGECPIYDIDGFIIGCDGLFEKGVFTDEECAAYVQKQFTALWDVKHELDKIADETNSHQPKISADYVVSISGITKPLPGNVKLMDRIAHSLVKEACEKLNDAEKAENVTAMVVVVSGYKVTNTVRMRNDKNGSYNEISNRKVVFTREGKTFQTQFLIENSEGSGTFTKITKVKSFNKHKKGGKAQVCAGVKNERIRLVMAPKNRWFYLTNEAGLAQQETVTVLRRICGWYPNMKNCEKLKKLLWPSPKVTEPQGLNAPKSGSDPLVVIRRRLASGNHFPPFVRLVEEILEANGL